MNKVKGWLFKNASLAISSYQFHATLWQLSLGDGG
jgi:hypothetical protein